MLSVRKKSENDIRCSVEPTLNVRIHYFVLQAATSEVCHYYARLVFPFQQNVLWLQIAMDYAEVLHVSKCREQLDGKSSDEAIFEALVVVHLDELIQVDAVEIKDAAQMVSEYKVVSKLHHSLNVVGVALLQQEKELCLDSCLIVIFLLVLDQLDGN